MNPAHTSPQRPAQESLNLAGNPQGVLAPESSGVRWGVLLLHGFTSGPLSMTPWAEALSEAGVKVRTPLLPGHGTRWQDLNRTDAYQWREAVQDEIIRLMSGPDHPDRIAVGGLSMGGVLALDAAAHVSVDHVFLVNPGLTVTPANQIALWLSPLLKYVVPAVPGIADDISRPGVSEHAYPVTPIGAAEQMSRLVTTVTPLISKVTSPVTVYRSAEDELITHKCVDVLRQRLPRAESGQLKVVPLPRSRHVATLDYDAELIHSDSLNTLVQLSAESQGETR